MPLLQRLALCCAAMLACCSAGCESHSWKMNRWDGPTDTQNFSVWDNIPEAEMAEFQGGLGKEK